MKGKWSPGKIAALVIGGIAAGMLLFAAFYIEVAQLLTRMRLLALAGGREGQGQYRELPDRDSNDSYADRGESTPFEQIPEVPYEEEPDEIPENTDYYEFHDAIRQDLSYQVDFEEYTSMFGTDNVLLTISYPVISPNAQGDMEGVNHVVQREVEELKEYVASISGEIDGETSFYFEAESYITYMDEDILSIAYVEYGYVDGEYYESYVVSVNIDMESKMALTNSQMLEVDDQFSVDFRNRSEAQNGEIAYLYNFTDQEITELLTDDESLIIFYTPLGMEVGFNYYYGDGWVTVTYKDYEKYQRRF